MPAEETSVSIELDARKFMRTLDEWAPGKGPPLRECLLTALTHMAIYGEADEFTRVIAAEFDIDKSTILRWAQGVQRPHFVLEKRVIAALRREFDLAYCRAA
ncbi:MAG TPA: hypothetical protein VL500_00380 [Candidatus Eisenbacteria bacterium]|jgi:hypothetical protein|nr:hypothetical protein [Candidatus Eisenbacteria bacterium]